jgi:hypothetical protein
MRRCPGLEGAPIRWITDDAMKFVEREIAARIEVRRRRA